MNLTKAAEMTEVAAKPSKWVAVVGWPLMVLIGGGAVLISLALVGLLVFLADIFVLPKGVVTTEYLTVVRLKGETSGFSGPYGYLYEVTRGTGVVADVQLPWQAGPGDRVRFRNHRSMLLRLDLPAEAPILCSASGPCD